MRLKRVYGIALILVCLALLVVGCAETVAPVTTETPSSPAPTAAPTTPSKLPAYELVSPADAAALISERGAGANFVILDVRTPEEYAAGHLEGAVTLNVNGDDFGTRIAAYDRNGTYLVYCRSGVRSRTATQAMQDLGFNVIYEVDGGIIAWEAAGQPLVQ